MDVITILTKEYNYRGDILEILNVAEDMPEENLEWRNISELIISGRLNPLWPGLPYPARYLNILNCTEGKCTEWVLKPGGGCGGCMRKQRCSI